MDEQEQKPMIDMSQPKEEAVMEETTPPTEPENEEKGLGPVLGSVIVVIILIIAAFFVWGGDSTSKNPPINPEEGTEQQVEEITIVPGGGLPTEEAPDTVTEELSTQGTSDEIAAIEEDLNDTMLDDLDKELAEIEKELAL